MENSNAVPKDEPPFVQLLKIAGMALLVAGGGMGVVALFIIGGVSAFS